MPDLVLKDHVFDERTDVFQKVPLQDMFPHDFGVSTPAYPAGGIPFRTSVAVVADVISSRRLVLLKPRHYVSALRTADQPGEDINTFLGNLHVER